MTSDEIDELLNEYCELIKTEETDGCYNPYNLVHWAVVKRMAEIKAILKEEASQKC